MNRQERNDFYRGNELGGLKSNRTALGVVDRICLQTQCFTSMVMKKLNDRTETSLNEMEITCLYLDQEKT